MPNTKWENKIDETGICAACRFHEVKEKIDWKKGKKELTSNPEFKTY